MKAYFTVVLLTVILTTHSHAQEVPVNNGSYNLSLCATGCPPGPGQWDGTWFDAPANPPKVVPEFNQHPTTHEWWSSFIWDPGLNTTHSTNNWSYPHSVRADSFGLQIYKNRLDVVDNNFPQRFAYQSWPNQAINVGITNMFSDSTWVVEYGDWHMKARWKDNNSASQLEATVVPGTPFVYFEKQGTEDLEVWISWDPIIDNTIGTNIMGITVQGSNYGLFAPTGSNWTQTNFTGNWSGHGLHRFNTDLNGQDYFIAAPLPDNSLATLQKFAEHAYVFITGTEMNYNFDEASATLTTTFTYETEVKEGTETNPIIGMLPHHWKHSTTPTNGVVFDTPRGELHCVDGTSFQTQMSNFGLLPQLPLTGNFPDLYQYIDDQMADNDFVESGDNYIGGKQIAKLSNLCEIADYVGHTTARDQFLAELKIELEDWLTSPDGEDDGAYFYYNALWHTMTPYYGILGPQLQNDHHFSIGYILRGAATIAKFDQVWAQDDNWGAMVNTMIRHVDSWDRNDPLFPYMRFHSPYMGHSIAGGSSARPGGAGQESSSEAINFCAAVYLWGLNSHNDEVRDMGMYLYLTEVETTKQYWWDTDGDNFPATYAGSHVWNVDGASHGKWTWFGGRPEYGVGINVSLMDAHLLYLAHDTNYSRTLYNQFVQDVRDYENNQALNEEQVWEDAIWVWRATFETQTIIDKYEALGPFPYRLNAWGHIEWDDPAIGTFNDVSPAHFYHWVHALDSLGTVNPTITANHSSYGVFDKNLCRHYVMYNPPGDPSKVVSFSDGQSFFLPEDTSITYKVCPCNDPITATLSPTDTTRICGGNQIYTASQTGVPPASGFEYEFWYNDNSGGNFVSIQGPTSSNTITATSSGDYYVTITDPSSPTICVRQSETLHLIIDQTPDIANAGDPQNICIDSTSLNAISVSVGVGTWTRVSGTGIISDSHNPNTSVLALSIGNNTFRWTISNGVCPSTSDELIINRTGNLTTSNVAGQSTTFCVNESYPTLIGTTIDTTSTPPESSSWHTLDGPVIVQSGTNAVIEPNSMSGGNFYRFVYEIANGVCPLNSSDTVVLSIDELPSTADAGIDQNICQQTFQLSANPPLIGSGEWSVNNTQVVINDNFDPNTQISGLEPGAHEFTWTVSNGTCPESSDEVTITVDSLPTIETGEPITGYIGQSTVINTTVNFGDISWNPIADLANSITEDPILTPTSSGQFTYTITVVNGSCTASGQIQVNVIGQIKIPNAFTPNNDGNNDTWVIYGLESYPNAELQIFNRWGSLVYNSKSPIEWWTGYRNGEIMPTHTYYFILNLGDGSEAITGSVTLVR